MLDFYRELFFFFALCFGINVWTLLDHAFQLHPKDDLSFARFFQFFYFHLPPSRAVVVPLHTHRHKYTHIHRLGKLVKRKQSALSSSEKLDYTYNRLISHRMHFSTIDPDNRTMGFLVILLYFSLLHLVHPLKSALTNQ